MGNTCGYIVPVQKAPVGDYLHFFDLHVASVDQKTVQKWKFRFKKQKVYNVTISECRVFILLFIFP